MSDQTNEPEPDTATTIIGDWRIVNQTDSEGAITTFMNQRCIDEESKKEVFQIGFQFNEGEKNALIEIWVPLGVSLPQGIKIAVSDENSIAAAYQSCFSEGCLATATLNEKFESGLRSADEGYIELTHVQGGLLQLPFSLNGFGEGLDKLKAA